MTILRNYWATMPAVVTKSAWCMCVILVGMLDRSRLCKMVHYKFAYLHRISSTHAGLLMARGGA